MHQFYDWFGLNVALFHLINGVHAGWWDGVMLTMTWLGSHDHFPAYMAMALLVAYARPTWVSPRAVVVFGLGYVLSGLVVVTLKPVVDLPRPLLALGREMVMVVGEPEFHHSFPSGHSTFAVLLAASLSLGAARPLKLALWPFALLVCLSRMSVGAHFPADVGGGALIGAASAAAAAVVVHRLRRSQASC
jgi:membrane-associated phospholipid phosphatase